MLNNQPNDGRIVVIDTIKYNDDSKIKMYFILTVSSCSRINVCGKVFITTIKSLEEYPKTLLGSPERERYYRPELDAYFFNRNRACFESILLFYQTGDEYPPISADIDLWEDEKAFFK